MKWLLVSAGLLAIGMIAAGVMAGSTLRQRDAVVREGLLTKTGHDIERELREGGPAVAADVLARHAAGGGNVSALELRTDDRVVQTAGGVRSGAPVEMPLSLGPSWRGVAGFRMGRGHTPFSLRLWASPHVGDSSAMAALTTWGSVFAALALLAFAAGAARGVTARQRAESLDGERRRLEVVSAAGAGLAHRIRNPLATIKATAQVLESQSEGTARERSTRIVDASLRIESLVNELLRFPAGRRYGGPRRGERRSRAAHRGVGHRKGARGAAHPPPVAESSKAVRGHQLRGTSRNPRGE